LRLEPDLDPEPEKLSKHEAATVTVKAHLNNKPYNHFNIGLVVLYNKYLGWRCNACTVKRSDLHEG